MDSLIIVNLMNQPWLRDMGSLWLRGHRHLTVNNDIKVVGSIPQHPYQQFFNPGFQKIHLGTLSQGNSNSNSNSDRKLL